MKKIFLITAVCVLCGFSAAARDNTKTNELWDEANTLYINGDYASAIYIYELILAEGVVSSKLYYNLGNAYFKDNSIGKAIVYYNKAQRMAPYDKDIEYNLAVANSYVKDRIDEVPDFFINNWIKRVRVSLSSNAWALFSLIFLAVALGFALVYVLAQSKTLRKAGFFTAAALLLLFFVTLSFSLTEKRKLINASEAIVTTSAVSVKSSPDSASKDLFIIHEGTKVEVLGEFAGWTEIMIADGNKGWLLESAIEQID